MKISIIIIVGKWNKLKPISTNDLCEGDDIKYTQMKEKLKQACASGTK